jgi:hypothetical protein
MKDTVRRLEPIAASALPGERVLPPESIVTAATVEEPLPLLMGAMALWGVGLTVTAILPLGMLALAASPLMLAGSVFRSSRHAG